MKVMLIVKLTIQNIQHVFGVLGFLVPMGYQDNKRRKVEAASPKVCIKEILQEDNNISRRILYAYAKDYMLE